MKTIEVTVAPTGATKVETKGFAGAACKVASKFIEQALGRSTSDTPTAEFYRTQSAEQTARQRS